MGGGYTCGGMQSHWSLEVSVRAFKQDAISISIRNFGSHEGSRVFVLDLVGMGPGIGRWAGCQ